MASVTEQICFRFKEARKSKGLNQKALADAVGCKQSAISMFEAGMTGKLSDETVKKLSEYLGVPLEDPGNVVYGSPLTGNTTTERGFCPNAKCPSNVPYVVDGRLFCRPSRHLASPIGGKRCVFCGDVLEMCCPVCGAPLNDGACCAACGSAYVTTFVPEGVDLETYAARRREEIAQLRSLS